MSLLNRRRFLSIAAAGGVLAGNSALAAAPSAFWKGRALGAGASMQLVGLEGAEASAIFAQVEAEILRLEKVFSLYLPDSEIAQLNANGILKAPSFDMLQVLSLSGRLNRATDGAFDPTIQSLWQAKATGADTTAARKLVSWQEIQFGGDEVSLSAGQSITLNGVAQGYITDKIAALLRAQGLRDVLVDMGEVVGLGHRPDGTAWKMGVAAPDGTLLHRVQLSDRALATSAADGTVLADGPHILDPAGRRTAHGIVSVSAPSAALADGLSTALCLIEDAAEVLAYFPEAELVLRT